MIILAALLMGFIGSLHCVAMCGAIAVSLQASVRSRFVQRQLIYNLGRIVTYVALAAVFASVHSVAFVNQGQNIVSLVAGSILFLVSLFFLFDFPLSRRLSTAGITVLSRFRSVLRRGKSTDSLGTALLVGMVNGLLPCGFVYLALATALTQPNVGESMLFMSFFGLGTVPSLLGLSMASQLQGLRRIVNSTRFISAATAVAGLLLVIRGMALGIPYLSPQLPSSVQTLNEIRHEQVCGSPQNTPKP